MSNQTMAFLEDVFLTAKMREVARVTEREVRFVRDLTGLDKRLAGPPPDVVLVDLTADSLKPVELIRQIKEQPEWASARIIAYASHARAELMEEANRVGADVVLSKPDFMEQLPSILQSELA